MEKRERQRRLKKAQKSQKEISQEVSLDLFASRSPSSYFVPFVPFCG